MAEVPKDDSRDRFTEDAPFPPKPPVKVKLDHTMVEAELDPDCTSDTAMMVLWSMRTAGFGQFYFCKRDAGVYCDNECMGIRSVRAALKLLIEGKPETEWPALLREYGGIEGLLAATTPSSDWS